MTNQHPYALRKYEILRKQQTITELFKDGKYYKGVFVKALYTFFPSVNQHTVKIPRVLFIVGKRVVRSAVKRNKIKRLMREAYRLEKSLFYADNADKVIQERQEQLVLAFFYNSKREIIPTFEAFRFEIKVLMERVLLSQTESS